MSWLKRLWNLAVRSGPGERTAIHWGDDLWLLHPPRDRRATVVGKLRGARARTWAGAVVNVAEHLDYQELLVLETPDGVCAPLKLPPEDPEQLLELEREAEAWTPGSDGPPFERPDHPWLTREDAERRGWTLESRIELIGLCYPMFQAGTIVPFRIWGYYVVAGAPQPGQTRS